MWRTCQFVCASVKHALALQRRHLPAYLRQRTAGRAADARRKDVEVVLRGGEMFVKVNSLMVAKAVVGISDLVINYPAYTYGFGRAGSLQRCVQL